MENFPENNLHYGDGNHHPQYQNQEHIFAGSKEMEYFPIRIFGDRYFYRVAFHLRTQIKRTSPRNFYDKTISGQDYLPPTSPSFYDRTIAGRTIAPYLTPFL